MKLCSFLIALILITSALAYTTTQITSPAAFSTQESTSVNVSGGINASAYADINGNDMVNVTIYNKSTSTGTYSVFSSHVIQASNSTVNIYWSQLITLQVGYNWIFLNFTNISSVRGATKLTGHAVTAARVVNIDQERFILDIGPLGIKIGDAGNASCSATTRGMIKYNISDGFMGCTAAGFKSLNSS